MNIQSYLKLFLSFINDTILPFLFTIAVIVFLWNLVHYSMIKGTSEEGREKARSLMLWGILALVVIGGLWGIVAIFTQMFGFDNRGIVPDYMCERGLDGNCRYGPDYQEIPDFNNMFDRYIPQEELERIGNTV